MPLTDRERETLARLDAETRDRIAARRAGRLSDAAFLVEMQRITGEKAVILMTKRDIKRTAQGTLDPDTPTPTPTPKE